MKFSEIAPSCLAGGWDVCFVPDANIGALYEYPNIPCFRDILSFNIIFLCFLLFCRYLNEHCTVSSYHAYVNFYRGTVPYT